VTAMATATVTAGDKATGSQSKPRPCLAQVCTRERGGGREGGDGGIRRPAVLVGHRAEAGQQTVYGDPSIRERRQKVRVEGDHTRNPRPESDPFRPN